MSDFENFVYQQMQKSIEFTGIVAIFY